MSAPLVVNTKDGACWTRRSVTEGGIALYALADVCSCPEFVMATLDELAARGIAGSADALPMPTGPEPKAQDAEVVAKVAELIGDGKPASDGLIAQLGESVRDVREHEHPKWEDLYCLNLVSFMGERMGPVLRRLLDAEARVAELEAELREFPQFYLADYEGAGLTLHLTREAARAACDDFAKAEAHGRGWDWRAEDGVEFQFWTDPDTDRPTGDTGGAVWEIRVEDSSGPRTYPPALPWARHMDDEDLSDFLDELAAAAGTPGSYEGALATVENAIAQWRLIGEAQHAHNTAPGPEAEDVTPQVQKLRTLLAGQREQAAANAPDEWCTGCNTDHDPDECGYRPEAGEPS